MRTIILNQRKERDELLSRPYLLRHLNQDTEVLLNSSLIKLIRGPRRVGKSTQALLMWRDTNFAYLNFDNQALLSAWDADLVMRMLDAYIPNTNISFSTKCNISPHGTYGSVNYPGQAITS